MVTYSDPKSKTGLDSDSRPGINVTQTSKGSGATIAYVIAALVVVIGAYLLFFNTPSTSPVVPSVTQNNTIVPAPEAVTPAPVTPAPDAATPPAMETAPAAPAPATPPATQPVSP